MSNTESHCRCRSCGQSFPVHAVTLNRWGDPCCPLCASPDIVRQRSRMATFAAQLFMFKVF